MGKRWHGRWLLLVSGIHTVFALVEFRQPLLQMARQGFFDSVGTDPMLGAVSWFVLFGGALALAGLAIDQLEARGAVPRRLGAALLGLVGAGVWLMPVSGFWLALPSALVMLRGVARG